MSWIVDRPKEKIKKRRVKGREVRREGRAYGSAVVSSEFALKRAVYPKRGCMLVSWRWMDMWKIGSVLLLFVGESREE